MECVLQCIFGVNSEALGELTFVKNGEKLNFSTGNFIRENFKATIERRLKFIRFLFDIFDEVSVGQQEKETAQNSEYFRLFLKKMINKRRREMGSDSFVSKGDFLTMLLQDELFKGQDEYIVDECLTFMAAASQTTTMLVSNAIYYLTKFRETSCKLRAELSNAIGRSLSEI